MKALNGAFSASKEKGAPKMEERGKAKPDENGNELSLREMAYKRAYERELAKRGISTTQTNASKKDDLPPEERPPENECNEREMIQPQKKHTKVLNKKQTVIIWLGLLPIAIELITTNLYPSSWRMELMELLVRSLGILIITALLVFTFRDKQ